MYYHCFLNVLGGLSTLFFGRLDAVILGCLLNPFYSPYDLKGGEFVQFESPHFPASVLSGEGNYKGCEGSFSVSFDQNSLKLWIFLPAKWQHRRALVCDVEWTNWDIRFGRRQRWRDTVRVSCTYTRNMARNNCRYFYSNEQWLTYYSNASNVNFCLNPTQDSDSWIAFQSFIYAPLPGFQIIIFRHTFANTLQLSESLASCPLANSSNAIFISDEFTIIPIASDFSYSQTTLYPKIICLWSFVVPPNYGLKVVLRNYFYPQNQLLSTLKVIAGADEEVLTDPGVYYFKNQSKFSVRFLREQNQFYRGVGFSALISAVRLQAFKLANCTVTPDGATTVFGNLNLQNGYGNLQVKRCLN